MRAGFAERDITPPRGMEMPGGSRRVVHEGPAHDPCKVRAAVFDDGSEQVALVSVDAVIVPRGLVQSARAQIKACCGIHPSSVMIAATHSHSAGPLGFYEPGQFDRAAPWIQRLAYEQSACADPGYVRHVREQIVSAVSEAWDSRVEVECGAAKGCEPKAAFNRRFRMRNGLTYTFPGQGNPDIVSQAGPIDPEVGVLGAWDCEGRLRGCVVNYACHLTSKPGGTSADWVFYLEEVIRAGLGSEVVVLFLNGACGDITPVDTMGRYQNQIGEKWARRAGARVGAAAINALLDAVPGTLAPVSTRVRQLGIPRRPPSPEKLEQARRLLMNGAAQEQTVEWYFARETVLLDALLQREPEADVELHAMQIGPAVLLACPGELFCELGLKLKASKQFAFVFPVSLANGFCGYLPTIEAMSATGGGYETRLTSHSNLEIGAGEKIVETLGAMAADLTPGPLPELPCPPGFTKAWNFGPVPAEC